MSGDQHRDALGPAVSGQSRALQLCSETAETYNTKELDDGYPIRLTNQAAKFDHSEERDYEFTW